VNFSEAESYLFSLGNEVEAMKLGLENIRTLLGALGNPHEKYLKIQVAGTNGKGSVCAFLDSICREAGIAVGLYTSPHLVSITERIRIDGVDMSEGEIAMFASIVRETAEDLLNNGTLEYRPTFFEHVTAMALLAFAEADVELAILETGLGGRLDATTAANAEIAAITRIDLDHQEYLGEKLEEIAAEKAAIIRSSTEAVVIGRQPRKALAVVWDHIREIPPPRPTVRECAVVFDESALGDPIRKLTSGVRLPGTHQVENAEVAVLLADILRKHFTITDDEIFYGLQKTRHPGRLEWIGNILLDGAHNPSGARALRVFLELNERRPITLVFGAMKDKKVAEMLSIIAPLAERIVLTRPSNSRALPVQDLIQLLPSTVSLDRVSISDGVPDAIGAAESVTPENGLILIAGSLFLIGEVRKLALSRKR
jgi:dihydrofolate synthase/folylpolyglutamate synthase